MRLLHRYSMYHGFSLSLSPSVFLSTYLSPSLSFFHPLSQSLSLFPSLSVSLPLSHTNTVTHAHGSYSFFLPLFLPSVLPSFLPSSLSSFSPCLLPSSFLFSFHYHLTVSLNLVPLHIELFEMYFSRFIAKVLNDIFRWHRIEGSLGKTTDLSFA